MSALNSPNDPVMTIVSMCVNDFGASGDFFGFQFLLYDIHASDESPAFYFLGRFIDYVCFCISNSFDVMHVLVCAHGEGG